MSESHAVPETSQGTLDFTAQDVEVIATNISDTLSKAMPEINYAGFSAYSILIPEILAQVKAGVILPQPQAIGVGWNIADGVFQIIAGILQIASAAKRDTHTPISTGIEGSINLGSGAQLIALTVLSPVLGPIGFAVAFGAAFTLSLKSTTLLTRLNLSDNAWFDDKFDQLKLFNEKKEEFEEREMRLSDIHNMMDAANQQVSEEGNEEGNKAFLPKDTVSIISVIFFEFLYNQMEKAKENFTKTQDDVFARLVTDYAKNGEKSYLIKKMTNEQLDQLTDDQITCLEKIISENPDYKRDRTLPIESMELKDEQPELKDEQPELKDRQPELKDEQKRIDFVNKILEKSPLKEKTFDDCKRRTQKVKKADRNAVIESAVDTLAIFSAFVGMVCLCIPAAQPFAAIFIGAAVHYFLNKYISKSAAAGASAFSFFKDISKKRDTKSLTNDSPLELQPPLK